MISRIREFIFYISGGFVAFVNIVSRAILSNYNFEKAIIVAYIIGMIVAYVLTKDLYLFQNNTRKSFVALL